MIGRLFVVKCKFHGNVKGLLNRSDCGKAIDYFLGLLLNHILEKGRQIGEMIVKGVAVNSAVVGNIPNGYFVYRAQI